VLDLKLIENEQERVTTNLAKRKFDVSIIKEINALNIERKSLTAKVENTRAQIKSLSKEVGQIKKSGGDASEVMSNVANLKKAIEEDEENLKSNIIVKINQKLLIIPNLIADDTPIGDDEESNVEIKRWGTPKKFDFEPLDHTTIGEKLGMLDFESAAKITGARFVVYKDKLARLERALGNFMIDHHLDKGYMEIIPPFIVHERSMYGTGQLPKFADEAFKLENFDWYLIPTAEVPVTNLKRDQIFSEEEFPFRYVAHTPCFRSEAGSHGKDTRGLIRMHQFSKVEMVNIVDPETSIVTHQSMVDSACEILEKLALPYRAVNLCTGDIGFSAQSTVDLEVWVPSQSKYREISSISNCGDFQARRANIRFKRKSGKKPEFAHTLNGSGLAVGRTLVAIMENYQREDGSVEVPEILVPYMRGIDLIQVNK
jgi:seryl-tRNA synthetase